MDFFRRKISIQNWNGFYAVYAKKAQKNNAINNIGLHVKIKYLKIIITCKNISQSHGTKWNEFYANSKNKHNIIKGRVRPREP
jgi:transcriptional regulator of met regulon